MNVTLPELIEKHLNATLTAGEAATLAQAMMENPALAEEFAAATRLEAALSTSLKDKERTALYTRRMERAAAETEPARTRRPWPVKSLAAAAGIAALIGIGWRLTEAEPVGKLQVKRGPASSTLGNTGDGTSLSPAGGTRIADASSMKRKLRRFASTTNRLRSVPVSQALAALQSEWSGYSHREAKDKETVFVVADAARKQWPKPEDEPSVSLEIPGISLLTSLELIAAQAGLKATVTAAGVSLDPETRRDDDKPRKWTIPLSVATVSTFMREVSSSSTGIAANWALDFDTLEFTAPAGMARAIRPSWMEMPEIAQVYGGTISPPGTSFPVAPIYPLSFNEDGTIIDLSLAPEIIEFEGFINYGEPIQTTGINGDLSHYEQPVILTDSKITQPDFILHSKTMDVTGGVLAELSRQNDIGALYAAGLMQNATILTPTDHPGNLSRLLAAHGMPAAGATWDQESGVVTARGSLSQLRAAQAAAAAVEEAATSGVTVEIKVIEWKGAIPAPAADHSGLLPPPVTGQSAIISAEAVSDLVGDPDLERIRDAKGKQHSGVPFTLKETQTYEIYEAKNIKNSIEAGVIAEVDGISRRGYSWHLPVNIRCEAIIGTEKIGDGDVAVRASREQQVNLHLQDGEWLRVDFPADGNAKAMTVLLGVQSATIP